jgi:hypothetical protein
VLPYGYGLGTLKVGKYFSNLNRRYINYSIDGSAWRLRSQMMVLLNIAGMK